MERKFLITSTFITLGAVAFLSGYLLMPDPNLQPTTYPAGSLSADRHSERGRTSSGAGNLQHFTAQEGSFLERFSNKVDIDISENKIPNTLPLSSRKFITFVQPFTDSKKIVAVTANGEITEIDLDNLIEKVVYDGQTTITEAILSPAGNSTVYSFYDAKNTRKWFYRNLKTGEPTEIEGELKSAAFSPDGNQAAYLVNRNSGGELLVAKDGKIIKRALKTRIGAATVSWPSENIISIISYDKDGSGDLFVLSLDSALNKVLSYQHNLEVKWSPVGEKIIFSTKDAAVPTQLFYKDIKNSGAITALGVDTNASKCVWTNGENVICGITDKTQVKDGFYKINLIDGSKTLVATPDINLLAKELALNRSGDTLFVLNDIDSKLYVLKIK